MGVLELGLGVALGFWSWGWGGLQRWVERGDEESGGGSSEFGCSGVGSGGGSVSIESCRRMELLCVSMEWREMSWMGS